MKIISIIRKDLKILLSDKKALAVILFMPLVLMAILSFALKGVFISSDGWNEHKVNIAVVKQYDHELDNRGFDNALNSSFITAGISKEQAEELATSGDEVDPEELFFEDFLGSEEVKKIITYTVEEEEKALNMMKSGEISAIVLLPEKFVYDMKISLVTPFRNKVNIKVLAHPERSINGTVVEAVIDAYSQAISSIIIGKNVLIETALAHDLDQDSFKNTKKVMDEISKTMKEISISMDDVTVAGRKPTTSADYYAAAMLTMFILFSAGHGGRMLLTEKEDITLQRMIIAGIPKISILAGKFFTIFLIALIQIVVMISFSHFVLKVTWGNMFSVTLISLAAAFAVAGIGAAIASATYRAGNYKMANIFETAVIQTMALLGGSFFPIDIMPQIFQKLSILSLNGLALKAYLKIMRGYGTADVLSYIIVLAGIGALFAVFAVLILREKGVINDAQHNKIKALKA